LLLSWGGADEKCATMTDEAADDTSAQSGDSSEPGSNIRNEEDGKTWEKPRVVSIFVSAICVLAMVLLLWRDVFPMPTIHI
jgi:hypothetical protein